MKQSVLISTIIFTSVQLVPTTTGESPEKLSLDPGQTLDQVRRQLEPVCDSIEITSYCNLVLNTIDGWFACAKSYLDLNSNAGETYHFESLYYDDVKIIVITNIGKNGAYGQLIDIFHFSPTGRTNCDYDRGIQLTPEVGIDD